MTYHVQHVVDHLKRDAQVESVAVHLLHQGQICAGLVNPDLRSGLEKRRRLSFDDLHVIGERHVGVAVEKTLQYLALGEPRAGIGGPLHDRRVEFSRKLEGLDEEKIACDQRRLEPELFVGGFLAAPRFGAVDDVVVEERGGVNQFERGGDIDDILDVPAAEGFEREQRDHRPDPLAAPADEMCRDIGQRWLGGTNRTSEVLLHQLEFFGDALERIDRVRQRLRLQQARDVRCFG